MKNLISYIISEQETIGNALSKLDKADKKILLLIDQDKNFLRTITDGDIRRLLLLGFNLDDRLIVLPPKKSISISSGSSDDEILKLIIENKVTAVPLIDNQKIIDIVFREDLNPSKILLSIPHMSGAETSFIDEAFNTNWIAPLGPNVDSFEEELGNYLGKDYYAAALNSGTSAIHLAIKLLGIRKGDTVLCSSFTFSASANPIIYEGAIPVFVDSEPTSWGMSPSALRNAIESLIERNKKPKALIVVHLYGQSARMSDICKIAREFSIPIIEDAAESMGSEYDNKKCGTLGDIGIFSFNGNKIITTSGGGALISKNKEIIERAKYFASQARTHNKPYYEHYDVGYNYRMSNVLAGIGRGQLKVLDDRVRQKREIFNYYKDNLDLDLINWQPELKESKSNRWLSVFSFNQSYSNISTQFIVSFLEKRNIEARYLWKPLHTQPIFKDYEYYPNSSESFCEKTYNHGLCLPSASSMTKLQQDKVIESLLEVFS